MQHVRSRGVSEPAGGHTTGWKRQLLFMITDKLSATARNYCYTINVHLWLCPYLVAHRLSTGSLYSNSKTLCMFMFHI